MALLDMITQAGGAAAIEQIGARVGLTPAQAHSAVSALLPALAGGLKRQSENVDLGGLLQQSAVSPEGGAPGDSAAMGNQILGHIFGSKEVSRTVAADAAASTGIGVDQLKALLPLLASLSAGALASKAGGLQAPGGLGGLLGMLDQDGDGNPMDEIMGMAGKFLGR
jgi:hypothetical protein